MALECIDIGHGLSPALRLSRYLTDRCIPGVAGVVQCGERLIVYANPGHAEGLIPAEFERMPVELRPGTEARGCW